MAVKKKKPMTKVAGKVSRKGHEVWRVTTDGRIRNLRTRAASTRAMDEAVIVYGNALQRLANR